MSANHGPATDSASPSMDGVTKVMVGVGAGLLAGLVCGVIARVMMRLVALVIGEPPGFDLGTTLTLCVIFGILVIPGAVATAFRARRTAVALLVLGTGAFAFGAAAEAVTVLDGGAFTGAQNAALLAIGVGFLAAAVGLGFLAARFARAFSTPRRPDGGLPT